LGDVKITGMLWKERDMGEEIGRTLKISDQVFCEVCHNK
jgi:hypothetical protein